MSDIDRAIVEVDAALIHIDRAGQRDAAPGDGRRTDDATDKYRSYRDA